MTNHQPSFSDIVDIDELQKLFEAFSTATEFTTGLVDQTTNEVLVGTGWRDICVKFHRKNPDSIQHCKASNLELITNLETHGQIKISCCNNGLVDGSTPIIIEGRHLANLFTGQILFAPPDRNRFKEQARTYGYDEQSYLDALEKVPVVNEETFRAMLFFLSHIATTVANIGLAKLQSQKDRHEIASQKALLESLINSIPDLLFYKNRENVYMGCNKAFEEYAGRKEEDIVGRTDFDLFPKEVAEFFRDKDQKVFASGKAKCNEERNNYPDGTDVLFDTLRCPYIGPDGNILGLIGLSRDITRLKQAEKQFNMFKVFAESSNQGMGWVDIDGNIQYINPALTELVGEKDQKIPLGKNIVRSYYPEAEQQRLMEQIFPSVVKDGSWSGELMIRQTSGKLLPTHNSLFLMCNESSEPACFAYIVADITEQKKIEKELLKVNKLESMGMLAGGLAHDFNNILAAILGNIELAEMSIDSTNEAYPRLQNAKKASIRAQNLTQQLLTFSKGGDPVRETFSIEKVVIDASVFVLTGSSVRCNYNISENLWKVDIDTGQLSQVIQNITLNARQAMPEGGVIEVTCENIADIKKEPLPLVGQKYIKITFTDTGSGIPEKNIDKIFDPYFSTKRTARGLGLAICHSIISKHDGNISVQSVVGKGTTFTIYLPASLQTDQAAAPSEEDLAEAECKAQILIMDDESMIRDMLKQMLEHQGHEVVLAQNGHEAISLYQEYFKSGRSIDIIIMDLTIPNGMGGKDAVQEILRINPEAKVIVASGYSNDPIMANYRDYGFKASIIKPFQLAELNKTINTVLK